MASLAVAMPFITARGPQKVKANSRRSLMAARVGVRPKKRRQRRRWHSHDGPIRTLAEVAST
jgi:hypothetical protein